jgi:class III poly(R)-hydroxyalkanoic acid synthase PhaE subunit
MSTQWPGGGSDNSFESLARQYWAAWGDSMRGGDAARSGTPNWQEAIDSWSKLAHGGREEANAAVERFNAQARNWYGQMQQVAAQFAGQDAKAADITAEWKRALGAIGENPFPEMFRAMRGQGAQGLEQWVEDASPYLEAWRRESKTMLGMPTFGIGREQQERWQHLAQAHLESQQHDNAYNALMLKAVERAYAVFEDKLAEREEPGRQVTSARALFDLWIDAAEEAYAGIALSPEFRKVYGARVNAQMRVRQGMQREVEQMSAMFGMPTRTEVDAAHRRIAELERMLRRMSNPVEVVAPAPVRPTAAKKPAGKPAAKPARKPAAPPVRKPAARKAAARKTPAKSAVGRSVGKPNAIPVQARKPVVSKPVVSKPVVSKTAAVAKSPVGRSAGKPAPKRNR